DDSLAAYGKSAELPANSTAVTAEYASALARLGRVVEAEDRFQKLLAQAPNDVSALIGLGSIRARSGNTDEAARLFDRAMSDPAIAPKQFELIATTWLDVSKPRMAVDALNRGLGFFPYAPSLLIPLTWIRATNLDDELRSAKEADRLANELIRAGGKGD